MFLSNCREFIIDHMFFGQMHTHRLNLRTRPQRSAGSATQSLHGCKETGRGRRGCRGMAKLEPEDACWWINLAYSVRRIESIEKAEAILLRAREIHPESAIIAFNLACYACASGRIEEAKLRLRIAISLDKDIRELAIEDEDLRTLRDWIDGLE